VTLDTGTRYSIIPVNGLEGTARSRLGMRPAR
jgi:hypothetical protein